MGNLTVGSIISNGISLGVKNLGSLIVNYLLWVLTIWIPYINVGTTIGLIGLVPKMSKGEIISPTEIFNPNYRKRMGDIFLVEALMNIGITIALIFIIIPGIVLSLAWMLAPYLVLDKGLNAMDAIHQSNEITSGKKWTIFGGLFVLELILAIAALIFSLLGTFGDILIIILVILFIPIVLGALAHIYGSLSS